MIDYTIMEYNIDTRRYTVVGFSEGIDSKEAKERYIKKSGWSDNGDTILFAKPPVCR